MPASTPFRYRFHGKPFEHLKLDCHRRMERGFASRFPARRSAGDAGEREQPTQAA